MKRKLYYTAMMISFCLLMMMSCTSDDDNNNPNDNSQDIAAIETAAESGTWRVSSYIDSGDNETNDFNGYTFTFSLDGTLTATNGITTYSGTWSVTNSSSSDDSSSDSDIDFNIAFPVPEEHDFNDLNDDWDVVSYSNTTLSLRDVSGGDGSIDTLIFERI